MKPLSWAMGQTGAEKKQGEKMPLYIPCLAQKLDRKSWSENEETIPRVAKK